LIRSPHLTGMLNTFGASDRNPNPAASKAPLTPPPARPDTRLLGRTPHDGLRRATFYNRVR
jgi:hypothetical protein